MSKFREKHAYGAVVGGLNFEVKNDHRNIAEQLNYIKDNLEKFLSDARSIHRIIREDSSILNEKQGLQAAATVWFIRWFLGKFRVKTFIATLEGNPDGNRTGKELYAEYLNKDSKISEIKPALFDQERLSLFDEALKHGEIVGGISFFKIFQHTYSLVKTLQKKFGDKAIHVSHIAKFVEGENEGKPTKAEKMVIAIAQEMHRVSRSEKTKKAKTEADTDTEVLVEEYIPETVENTSDAMEFFNALQNGEMTVSDFDDVALLNEMREMATGGLKSAITRRRNALQA